MKKSIKKYIVKKRNRSGKFPCDICKEAHILEVHHINGRKVDNFDANWNKCSICSNCHTDSHAGNIVIECWVMTTEGKKLLWHKKGETSFSGNDAKVHIC